LVNRHMVNIEIKWAYVIESDQSKIIS
jgi:hypothetical protein